MRKPGALQNPSRPTAGVTDDLALRPQRCNNPRDIAQSHSGACFHEPTCDIAARPARSPTSAFSCCVRACCPRSCQSVSLLAHVSASLQSRAGADHAGVAAADPADEAAVRTADRRARRTHRLAGAGQSRRGACHAGEHGFGDGPAQRSGETGVGAGRTQAQLARRRPRSSRRNWPILHVTTPCRIPSRSLRN